MASSGNKLDKKVYKKLITDISSQLSDTDTRHIAYHNEITSYTDALDLFTQLERAGCIGRDNISELEELLTSIKRQDLVAKLRDTISKNQGRRVSQSLKLPEPEHMHIEKRANTISGPTYVRLPRQESGGSSGALAKHHDVQVFHPTTESIQENTSHTEGAETDEQLQSVQSNDRVDSKKPRSRHSSERVGLALTSNGTPTQRSRSTSRSPSAQTTHSTLNTSIATSANISTSDLSSVSSHNNIPQTESERKFILFNKMLELMNSTPATVDSDTVSESGDEQSRQMTMTTLENMESRERSSTLCSRSADAFESSHESRESNSDHRHSSGLEASTELPSKGASKPSSHLPRRPSKLKVSRLLSWKKSRSRASSGDGQTLTWTVKRDQLNKPIFRHQQDHTIEWKKKVEVDVGNGSSFNPILSFILHPYGLKEDCRRYVTLEVRVAVPKKAPKLKKATCVKLTLLISEGQGDTEKKIQEHSLTKHLDLRVFYQSRFISHRMLRQSNEVVNVIIQAECIFCDTT